MENMMSLTNPAKVGDKVRITASNKQLRSICYNGEARHGGIYTVTSTDFNDITILNEEADDTACYINHDYYEVVE